MKEQIAQIEAGKALPLVEEFYTIQGEGFHTGKAAYFIRIGGCDIGCRWCDSKITWSAAMHGAKSIEDIVHKVLATPAKSVVVTGGEPTLYNLNPLTSLLKKHQVKTFLETSGAYDISGDWDWICLSPKTNKHPKLSSLSKANELKVIIYNFEEDIAWAELQARKVTNDCKLYLQPEWSRFKKNIDDIVNYVKTNPQWELSLQSHKFAGVP
ncbi:organic radical activating enzyme [Balneicella halophila]|uniref:7-carboxy-7-deazaguanine synthase n=1 Tax=Balneicella halophila TaxID=1537566 RepID=A0A7L4URV8_BALHA|nr:7-carboxy-7-deazaguanine synthase QueE [Balneicella halophila]PVX52493.1 organic radical activating enzyme [Balneicella halophila]